MKHYRNKSLLIKRLLLGLLITNISVFSAANDQNSLNAIHKTGNIKTEEGSFEIFKNVNIPSDRKAIRYFFSYTCPFSRNYDSMMYKWGKTLPKPLVYVRVPVVTEDAGSYLGAMSFYTVARIAPDKVDKYQLEVYSLIQDQRKSTVDFETYAEAAYRVGINLKKFSEEVTTTKSHNLTANASILAAKYQVISTPSMGIGGRYSFSSEIVDPKNGNLVTVANAMVSKFISEVGLSKK